MGSKQDCELWPVSLTDVHTQANTKHMSSLLYSSLGHNAVEPFPSFNSAPLCPLNTFIGSIIFSIV